MSEFEKWFRSLNANGKTVYFLGNEHKVPEMAWNHQQAIIDNLKAQLNNMEACYIEKKKQVEDQYKKVDGLQKENAALVHVIKSRDIQLENEKHEYDELVNKLVDSKMKNTKLQKLINEALEDLEYPVAPWDETIGSVVKVLRGEE